MNIPFPYFGESLSLLTAILWGFGVILFKKSGERTAPIALNLFKNSVAFLLLIPTMLLLGTPFFNGLPWRDYLLVIASGAIGIGIADSVFFASLNKIGAGRMAVVEASYSPFVIYLSFLFLGERLNSFQTLGAGIIVMAILVATVERHAHTLERKTFVWGVFWAIVSNFLMAVGLVMIKEILEEQPLLWVVEWRLVGGIAVLLLVLLFHPNRARVLRTLRLQGSRRYTILGSIVGAYLVLITWLGGMKYTTASAASALNQTSTIFTFLLAGLFLSEPLTGRRWIAILLAVGGALLVTFG
ncbi:DMT family transporter [bacterium]|nr:DMT family transporter [bacterium]